MYDFLDTRKGVRSEMSINTEGRKKNTKRKNKIVKK